MLQSIYIVDKLIIKITVEYEDNIRYGMWQSYALLGLYMVTMKIGIAGNLWVIYSIIRNSRPKTLGWLRGRPSECLRCYILILAFVDLVVVCSLPLRIIYIWDETMALG